MTEQRTNTGAVSDTEPMVALFSPEETAGLRNRWLEIQAGFVDRPREIVEQADELVGEVMRKLTAQFSDQRLQLEADWDQSDDVSTEDLRVALTRYRSFFERLLAA